jgi:hypothetical protein
MSKAYSKIGGWQFDNLDVLSSGKMGDQKLSELRGLTMPGATGVRKVAAVSLSWSLCSRRSAIRAPPGDRDPGSRSGTTMAP